MNQISLILASFFQIPLAALKRLSLKFEQGFSLARIFRMRQRTPCRVSPPQSHSPLTAVMKSRFFFLLSLFALLTGVCVARDYVIVVDTSGSMLWSVKGEKKFTPTAANPRRIDLVKPALKNGMEALPEGTRVTLIEFNTGVRSVKDFVFDRPAARAAGTARRICAQCDTQCGQRLAVEPVAGGADVWLAAVAGRRRGIALAARCGNCHRWDGVRAHVRIAREQRFSTVQMLIGASRLASSRRSQP